jgi:mannose-6-phosphate isomerase
MDRLANPVRPYAWGSPTAIPQLLGVEPTGEPQAELWMGAHPGAPSRIDRGNGPVALSEVIAADPEGELGRVTAERFGGRLPFLLKILAADAPLSLQVHPDPVQAEAGFADEEMRGVPIDAPHRNYKDPSHKPELICALTPFDGLCGFRPETEAAELLASLEVDSLDSYVDILHGHPDTGALREVLTAILTADRTVMARAVTQAAAAADRLAAVEGPHRDSYAAYASLARHHPGDPGVIAAMLLNHVRLEPGEALFLDAGVPHAYLGGLGIEVLANSDNVLRCGLTSKHVDVPELLRIVRFEPATPNVLRPEAVGGKETYEPPVDEFRLSRYTPTAGAAPVRIGSGVPQILLCTAGAALLSAAGGFGELRLERGESVFVPAGEDIVLSGEGTVFHATVAG